MHTKDIPPYRKKHQVHNYAYYNLIFPFYLREIAFQRGIDIYRRALLKFAILKTLLVVLMIVVKPSFLVSFKKKEVLSDKLANISKTPRKIETRFRCRDIFSQ